MWQPEKSTIPHAREQLVKAYMDFLIAQLAETFIGNRLSTFSMELFHIFNDVGKTALFVNQLECPLGKALTYFGCQPVNFMDCCIWHQDMLNMSDESCLALWASLHPWKCAMWHGPSVCLQLHEYITGTFLWLLKDQTSLIELIILHQFEIAHPEHLIMP